MADKKPKLLKDVVLIHLAERKKNSAKRSFFLPDLSWFGLLRLGLVVLVAYLFFSLVCRPAFIRGGSMKPTYPAVGFNFCWRPVFWFSQPERGQVVVAKYAGEKIMLLKRVVALAGDTVEFRDGKLWVNGTLQQEPYVKYPCSWNLPPRKVEPGYVYIVGDNRNMPIHKHKFGQIARKRVIGVPLW